MIISEGHCFKIDSMKFNDSVARFEPYGINHLHNHLLCCDFKLGVYIVFCSPSLQRMCTHTHMRSMSGQKWSITAKKVTLL